MIQVLKLSTVIIWVDTGVFIYNVYKENQVVTFGNSKIIFKSL